MSDEPKGQMDKRDIITPDEHRNIWIWAIMLIALFSAIGIVTTWDVYQDEAAANQRHDDWMNPDVGEGGTTPPPAALPAGANPLRVDGGIYLDRIPNLSLQASSWTADFYVWFRWRGEQADPGEDLIVVDGSIDSKEKQDEYTSGDEHYTLYRVVARITKPFDVQRFPRADHLLTIELEPPAALRDKLLFVADNENSGVSSRVAIPGYSTDKSGVIEKPHAYRSTLGDPRLAAGTEQVVSQLRMGLLVQEQDWGFYIKMFCALFAAVGVALTTFFLDPTYGPRFGIGVGALFAAVASTYVNSTLVPHTGVITLADMVNLVGIVTIGLSILQSTISVYLYDSKGREALSRLFDRVSFAIFLVAYVLINLALPLAATY